MIKWFLFHHGQVKGPFTTSEVHDLSEASEGLFWGRGLNEWIPYTRWVDWQDKQEQDLERTKVKLQRQWRARIINQDHEPMSYTDLLELLKGRSHYDDVWVWTEGYSEWQPIFGFHKLMDDLGLGRRAHPRIPVRGEVEVKCAKGQFQGRAMSLSEGGMGIADIQELQVGDLIHVTLKNSSFVQPIRASGEVVYIEHQTFTGVKFTQVSSESRSLIIEYVKHYLNEHQGSIPSSHQEKI
jgi:hypothetical protein